jgi:hypothetical protein
MIVLVFHLSACLWRIRVPLIEVPDARFQPCMDSFLGAACGMLKALGDDQPLARLWGLSGLGFHTQTHRSLAPVGLLPPKWDETFPRILRRLGHDCVAGLRDHFHTPKDLRELQLVWMGLLEKSLEDGRPAIAFGLHGPAFGLIRGFDSDTEEYHVSTCMDGRQDGPVNAQEIGSMNPPLIFVLIPSGYLPDYDADEAARAALTEAVDHHLGRERDAQGQPLPVPADLVSGPAAYNAWSAAIETAQVQPHWGAAYYAGYYAEARSAAAEWLRELAERPAFASFSAKLICAARHLDHEVESFRQLPPLFPLHNPETLHDPARRTQASACLRAARAEHIAGMEALIEVVEGQGEV